MLDFGYCSIDNSLPNLGALANASVLSFDTETSGVNTAKDIPYGFSITADPNSAYYTYMSNRFFTDLLADENKLKVTHNAKFDRSMVKKYGVVVDNLCCTMIAAHLLEENRLSLEVLLKRFIKGYDLDVKFFKDFNKPLAQATLQEMTNHFGPHSAATLALWNVLQRELRANGLWNVFWKIEMPLVPVLSDMELNGAMIDVGVLSGLGTKYDERIEALDGAMKDMAKNYCVNFNSPDQAAEILYEQFKVPKPPQHMKALWTESGRPTMDRGYLEQFKGSRYPIVNLYLMYKMYRHLKDTYVNGILERLVNGRIHTNFNQTRTRTGRLSSTDPNLQNIPQRTEIGKEIRTAFVAPEGKKIIKPDMDQVELRKMACLSNCKALLDAFREKRDVHSETALRAYGSVDERPDGKTLNFRLIYGGGTEKDQALLFSIYPEVKQWTESRRRDYEILGYARTHYGRKRHLGDFDRMSGKEAAHAHREGISTEDQGSCAEYLKLGMRKVWEDIKDSDVKMLLQVHDELVLECPDKDVPEVVDLLKRHLTYNELQIPLPVSVSVGMNWAETEKIGANNGN